MAIAPNVQPFPDATRSSMQAAKQAATPGNQAFAMSTAAVAVLGANPVLYLEKDGVNVAEVVLAAPPDVEADGTIVIGPAQYQDLVRLVGTIDTDGEWFGYLTNSAKTAGLIFSVVGSTSDQPAAAKLSGALQSASSRAGFIIGELRFTYDPLYTNTYATTTPGTTVPSAPRIVLPTGRRFELTSEGKILINGVLDAATANVDLLLHFVIDGQHYAYQHTTANLWWRTPGTPGAGWEFQPSGDPRLLGSLPTPPAAVTTDVFVGAKVIQPGWFGFNWFRWPTNRDGDAGGSVAPVWTPGAVRLGWGLSGTEWFRIAADPNPANWDWSYLDAAVDYWFSRGVKICYTLMWTPVRLRSIVSPSPISGDPYFSGTNSTPTDLTEVENFLFALVSRYNSGPVKKLHWVVIWNEMYPDGRGIDGSKNAYFTGPVMPTANTPADKALRYRDMARICWWGRKGVKRADPNLPVLTGAWSPGEGVGTFIAGQNALLDAPIPEGGTIRSLMDGCDGHPYASTDSAAGLLTRLDEYVAMRDATMPGKILICDEMGDETGSSNDAYHMRHLTRRFILGLARGYETQLGWGADSMEFVGAPNTRYGTGQAGSYMVALHALIGKTLRRVSILTDGTVWLACGDGTTLRV